MKHLMSYKSYNENMVDRNKEDYQVGTKLKARSNYLDGGIGYGGVPIPSLTKKGNIYEIIEHEINLGEDQWVLKDIETGKKVSGWWFKKFELDINFTII